jgi:hypothetical protein
MKFTIFLKKGSAGMGDNSVDNKSVSNWVDYTCMFA